MCLVGSVGWLYSHFEVFEFHDPVFNQSFGNYSLPLVKVNVSVCVVVSLIIHLAISCALSSEDMKLISYDGQETNIYSSHPKAINDLKGYYCVPSLASSPPPPPYTICHVLVVYIRQCRYWT